VRNCGSSSWGRSIRRCSVGSLLGGLVEESGVQQRNRKLNHSHREPHDDEHGHVDDEPARSRPPTEDDTNTASARERRWQPCRVAEPIYLMMDGAEVKLVAHDRRGHGALQRFRAHAVEELEQSRGGGTQDFPPLARWSISLRADGTASKSRSKPRL
jgi:hypothetical protein